MFLSDKLLCWIIIIWQPTLLHLQCCYLTTNCVVTLLSDKLLCCNVVFWKHTWLHLQCSYITTRCYLTTHYVVVVLPDITLLWCCYLPILCVVALVPGNILCCGGFTWHTMLQCQHAAGYDREDVSDTKGQAGASDQWRRKPESQLPRLQLFGRHSQFPPLTTSVGK